MMPYRFCVMPPTTIDPVIEVHLSNPRAARFEFQSLRAQPKQQASVIRNQSVAAAAIAARRFLGIAINHHTMKHRMVHAADFVLEEENVTIALRVYDVLEAKLMIAHVFGNQAAFLRKA